MVQKCSNCGTALLERSKFCPACGEPRPAAKVAVAPSSQVLVADGDPATLGLNTSAPRARVVPSKEFPKPQPPSTTYANFGQRLNALVFDVLLLMILIMASTFAMSIYTKKSIFSSNVMLVSFYLVSIGIYAVIFVVLPARRGQTLGKQIMGIRIIKPDGDRPGILTMLLRHVVGYLLSLLGGMVGFLWAAWDAKHQGWHDKIARTVVVDAR